MNTVTGHKLTRGAIGCQGEQHTSGVACELGPSLRDTTFSTQSPDCRRGIFKEDLEVGHRRDALGTCPVSSGCVARVWTFTLARLVNSLRVRISCRNHSIEVLSGFSNPVGASDYFHTRWGCVFARRSRTSCQCEAIMGLGRTNSSSLVYTSVRLVMRIGDIRVFCGHHWL